METKIKCPKCEHALVAECHPDLVRLICSHCGYMEVICQKKNR
jgi:ribosomal protein S27AE